jgi:hypothetical protein
MGKLSCRGRKFKGPLMGKLSCRGRRFPWWEIALQCKRSISFIIWNQIPWCEIILHSNKIIAFMLLIIDKCLMAIELSSKERNSNITTQTSTPWKKGRIILVVVCKSTFLNWVVWFWTYGTIICVIFWGGIED